MSAGTGRHSRVTRRNFLRAAAGSAVGLVGLSLGTACAPSQTPAPTQALAAPAAPTAAPAAATAAPAVAKLKQDILMGIGTDVVMMDTRISRPTPAQSQIFHVEEPLFFPNEDGKAMGILAASWEPVTSPPGWRFKLRPNLKFTNGEPFNAQAVKYTVESILADENKSWIAPDAPTRLALIKEVKVEDDLTATMVTETFYRVLPINLYQFPLLPPKLAAEKGKEFGVSPVGTGHYKFVEYRSKSQLRLEATADYQGTWGARAKNDTVTFRFLSENATRVAALEAGEVHLIDNLPPDAVERIKNNPNLGVMTSPSNRINGMFFHCNRPPFNNLKARLAVAHAIDRDAIVKKIMGSMTDLATAPFPPNTLGTVGETFPPFEFDLNKAKQYFKDAGLTNGTKIKLGGPVGRYINDKQVVTAVASMISEVGFDPQIEQLEFGTYMPKYLDGYYDLFYLGISSLGYDPVEYREVYMGQSPDNGGSTHFVEQNKRVVELFDLANKTPSQQEAEGHYKELAHLIWDNVPIVQLFYEPFIAGVSKKLKGWKPRRDSYVFLWDAYLE